jgi:hypothetical protein
LLWQARWLEAAFRPAKSACTKQDLLQQAVQLPVAKPSAMCCRAGLDRS